MKSIGAVLLAAGLARRMGDSGHHKLLAEFDGEPLVRRSARTLVETGLAPIVVVTGHRREEIEEALSGLDLMLQFNANYIDGMGTSIASGFGLPDLESLPGVVIMLADMPEIRADHVRALVSAFLQSGGRAVVRASSGGAAGHPLIVPQALYDRLKLIGGDMGAKSAIDQSGLEVVLVEIGPAAVKDVDTPDAIAESGGLLRPGAPSTAR